MNKFTILAIIGFFTYAHQSFGMIQGNIITQNGVTRTVTSSYIKYENRNTIATYSKLTGDFTVHDRNGRVLYVGSEIPPQYEYLETQFELFERHA